MYLENLVINQKRIKKIRYRRILINDITFRADLFDLKCQLDVLTIRNKMFVCYGLQLVIKQWISVDFSSNNMFHFKYQPFLRSTRILGTHFCKLGPVSCCSKVILLLNLSSRKEFRCNLNSSKPFKDTSLLISDHIGGLNLFHYMMLVYCEPL